MAENKGTAAANRQLRGEGTGGKACARGRLCWAGQRGEVGKTPPGAGLQLIAGGSWSLLCCLAVVVGPVTPSHQSGTRALVKVGLLALAFLTESLVGRDLVERCSSLEESACIINLPPQDGTLSASFIPVTIQWKEINNPDGW